MSTATLQERLYKTKITDVNELPERIAEPDQWDKPDQRFINKAVGEWRKRLEFVWLQEEDSLNIRCEHFSLLTFCHVLF